MGVCEGTLADGGGNVAVPSATPCPGLAASPGLGALADNGGPTQTMALTPGSPAVDRVPAPCGTAPDQRGVARPPGAGCDAGSYELAPPTVVTGAASQVTENSATVAGQVNPNARATSWHIEFGRTSAYGSQTADQALAAGFAPASVTAALTGLQPGTATHYRLVATNADGTTAGADATFTTTRAPSAFRGAQIIKRALTMSKTGDVPVTVTCPAQTAGACTGTLAMTARVKVKVRGASDMTAKANPKPKPKRRRKRKTKTKTETLTLARAALKLTAGSTKTIHLHLGSSAQAVVRAAGKRGLTVTLTATVADANGISVKTTVSTTLTRARR